MARFIAISSHQRVFYLFSLPTKDNRRKYSLGWKYIFGAKIYLQCRSIGSSGCTGTKDICIRMYSRWISAPTLCNGLPQGISVWSGQQATALLVVKRYGWQKLDLTSCIPACGARGGEGVFLNYVDICIDCQQSFHWTKSLMILLQPHKQKRVRRIKIWWRRRRIKMCNETDFAQNLGQVTNPMSLGPRLWYRKKECKMGIPNTLVVYLCQSYIAKDISSHQRYLLHCIDIFRIYLSRVEVWVLCLYQHAT
jgi:hypothetical protein